MTKELLQKFISSSCSEAEQEYVYSWISDPENKEEVSAIMKTSWDNMPKELHPDVRSKASFIKAVLDNDKEDQLDNIPTHLTVTKKLRLKGVWSFVKIAASIIVVLGFSFSAYQNLNQPLELEEVVFIEKSNPYGRKSTIVLPDGSKVKLNSDSKIKYASRFNIDRREVILEGEAFFEVKKDKRRPFIVRTRDITTTVLGTSFNVKAFAKSDAIEVAVVTGKVEVKKAAYSINENERVVYLEPNQMAIYQRESRELETDAFNMEEIIGWKDGILIFENADINQMASMLEKWYGVEIEIDGKDSTTIRRYTGKFDNNSLEYVLKAISYTSDMNFKITNSKVELN